MAGGTVYGASNFTSMLQNHQRVPCSSEPLDALLLSASSPSLFGPRSMLSFEDVNAGHRPERSVFRPFDPEGRGDDDLDEYLHQPEKKRRLTGDQVQFLEKSFEVENKLEPERKVQIAKKLGLQPRQVAIWFQNRRARWKTKQLERDYEVLRDSYNGLKADYDSLHEEKDKLKAEVLSLTDRLLKVKDRDDGNPNSELPQKREDNEGSKVSNAVCKQEELCLAKSDVIDSDCRHGHGTDAGHSSVAEPGDSSNAYEPDQSDLSQDEEDDLGKSLLPTSYIFPKVEDADYPYPQAASSCSNFGFSVEDQHAFWPWP